MINPAILCVPAMSAAQAMRRQQERGRHFEPMLDTTKDRDAHKRYIDQYVEKLIDAGFEVFCMQDFVEDRTIIRVRKGNIAYCTSVDNNYCANEFCMDREIQLLVQRVDDAFAKLGKDGDGNG